MSDRLILERECSHGYARPHWLGPSRTSNVSWTGQTHCPGGERREVIRSEFDNAVAQAVSDVFVEHIKLSTRYGIARRARAGLGLIEEVSA